MINILVTGATGCLGYNLVNKLLQNKNKYNVIATGRNLAKGSRLKKLGAKFIAADLKDPKKIIDLCKNKDIIFHCGALSSVWGKRSDFYNTNIIGTKNIIDGCLNHNVNRLIYISTPSLYFDFHDKLNIKESDTLAKKPVNLYAKTKKIAESLIDKAYNKHNLPVITLRPRAVFGPYDEAIIPRILKIAHKGFFPLFNNGEALIDVTHVDNVVLSMINSIYADNKALGNKFNITNDEPIKLKTLLEYIFQEMKISVKFKKISYKTAYLLASILEKIHLLLYTNKEPILTKYGVGVLSKSQTLDISKAKEYLNYKPIISVHDGIKQYCEWYENNN